MCGICGFIGDGDIDDLRNMSLTIKHRGPDGKGYWVDTENHIFIAHRRLSIIDIDNGSQPMISDDGRFIITFNGEIYNHREIRQELEKKGLVFKSNHSDTEVLLLGYSYWGSAIVHKLNGMWAFGIYDRLKKEMFLSRDRFGQKPLFYYHEKGLFAFGSELLTLTIHKNIPKDVDTLSLQKYFAYNFIPAPNTIYKNIKKLQAGHNLIFNIDSMNNKCFRYWKYLSEPLSYVDKRKEEYLKDELIDLLQNAVKRRMMSDVPLGVFLSGGIDSTAITAFASQLTGDLQTFSMAFNEPSFDESKYAKCASAKYGTNSHIFKCSIDAILDAIPNILGNLDEPMGDSSILPTYLLCQNTSMKVKVVLGGDGADELFAGYDPYKALWLANIYKKNVPSVIHKGVKLLIDCLPVSFSNLSLDFKLKKTLDALGYNWNIVNAIWMGALNPNQISLLFGTKYCADEIYSEAIECWNNCDHNSIYEKTQDFFINMYLPDDILVKIDRSSMLNSLEVRSPFLDIDLVNFISKLPFSLKYRFGSGKYILKKALERTVPDLILKRRKKGFGLPIGSWFNCGNLTLDKKLLENSFINQAYLKHLERKSDKRLFLWNLYTLSHTSLKFNYYRNTDLNSNR